MRAGHRWAWIIVPAALAAVVAGGLQVQSVIEPARASRARHALPQRGTALAPVEPGASLDRGDNGVWLSRYWLYGERSPSEVAELAAVLRQLGIRRVYPFLGSVDAQGRPGWRDLQGQRHPYLPGDAQAFLRSLRAGYPEAVILPWTGGVLGRDIHFGDTAQSRGLIEHATRLMEMGADGVHLNIEPLPSGTMGLVDLLRELRHALGAKALLSVAAIAPGPRQPWAGQPSYWSLDYARAVCHEADEIVVMGYDTWLTDRAQYQRTVADWTEDLALGLPATGGCQWLMGVPSHDDEGRHHHPDVERLDVALRGVREGLMRTPVPESFRGVALYAGWTTDALEWANWDAVWRNREPTAGPLLDPVVPH